jgi:hypothetical protein
MRRYIIPCYQYYYWCQHESNHYMYKLLPLPRTSLYPHVIAQQKQMVYMRVPIYQLYMQVTPPLSPLSENEYCIMYRVEPSI